MATKTATRRTARPKADDTLQVDALDQFEPYHAELPISTLRLSALNVRQTDRDADIASLAEDIAARGLKQNLTVVPAHYGTAVLSDDQPYTEGLFEVSGGGRRTQALQLLVSQGRLEPDHLIRCLVEPRSEARETSLSENLHRVAMNPGDEFEAFRQIVDQLVRGGMRQDDAEAHCARRFGVSARHVAERLRLAALSPTVMEALRTGAIGVDSAKAYATHADHALQDKVFASQAKSNYQPHAPRAVRDALRGLTVGLDDLRFEYVGMNPYRAAGGRTEVEMFMGDAGTERVVDVALLDNLVAEKAEGEVEAIVSALGFAGGVFAKGIGYATTTPKTPAGHVLRPSWNDAPEGEERAKAIAVFRLGRADVPDDIPEDEVETHRGEPQLEYYCAFMPVVKPAEGEDGSAAPGETRDWAAERAATIRAESVAALAARMALGGFEDTKFAGRTFWPTIGYLPNTVDFEFVEDTDCDAVPVLASVLVEVLIRVPADQLDQHREAAEARFIEIEEAKAAARAAAQAAIDEQRQIEADEEAEEDAMMDEGE